MRRPGAVPPTSRRLIHVSTSARYLAWGVIASSAFSRGIGTRRTSPAIGLFGSPKTSISSPLAVRASTYSSVKIEKDMPASQSTSNMSTMERMLAISWLVPATSNRLRAVSTRAIAPSGASGCSTFSISAALVYSSGTICTAYPSAAPFGPRTPARRGASLSGTTTCTLPVFTIAMPCSRSAPSRAGSSSSLDRGRAACRLTEPFT